MEGFFLQIYAMGNKVTLCLVDIVRRLNLLLHGVLYFDANQLCTRNNAIDFCHL